MIPLIPLLVAAGLGFLLGSLFFGGLWWTVRRALASDNPGLWFFGSSLLRLGCSVAGFYFVSQGDWRNLLACLMGFFIARVVVIQATKIREGSHAP